jgi:hypothetical protein
MSVVHTLSFTAGPVIKIKLDCPNAQARTVGECTPSGTRICLAAVHIASRGLGPSWGGPDMPITAAAMPVLVTLDADGGFTISAGPPPVELDREEAARQLAAASQFIRYHDADNLDDRWRMLLTSPADVGLAYAKAVKRSSDTARLEHLRDLLLGITG